MISEPSAPVDEPHRSNTLFSDLTFLSSGMLPDPWMANSPQVSRPPSDMSGLTLFMTPKPQLRSTHLALELPLPAVLESYYYYCHSSHPFLPHKALLQELLNTKPLPFLESALRYTVACYTPRNSTNLHVPDTLLSEVIFTHTQENYAETEAPYMLQALLLLAVVSGSQGHSERSWELLAAVRDLALRLGLNRSEFAIVYGEGDPVLEDCWRRPWWEVYVIDTMQTGLHKWEVPLSEVVVDVLVPSGSWDEREVWPNFVFIRFVLLLLLSCGNSNTHYRTHH
jgi:hypothetical protein